MLLAEQLLLFYELQPEVSTLQDMTAQIRGIEVIESASNSLMAETAKLGATSESS